MVLVFNKFFIKCLPAARTPPCCLDDAVEKTRSDWTEERLRHALFNVLAAQTNNYTFFNDNLGHMTNWFSPSTA